MMNNLIAAIALGFSIAILIPIFQIAWPVIYTLATFEGLITAPR